ncbi:kinase-like domain-containing protein [Flagelloscypha sp. PMI_526]|nr:kinase-like domain-containing protein [Flagelloscypha sp. PMI_526]
MDPELEAKIQEVQKHIQTEVKILNASKAIRQATTNQDVLRRNEAKIRETERSLSYFQDTLRELQSRRNGNASGGGPPVPSKSHAGGLPARPTGQARKYSKLELLMVDTPYTPAKISTMLSQLEFKLKVEEQYKQGSDKMARLYQMEGDKKSKMDADGKRVEIERKIQLLGTALKRYKNLHVLDAVEEDEEVAPDGPERKDNMGRKPISGTLYVTVIGAQELEHIPVTSRKQTAPDCVVSLKVEGTQLARSHPSRTDRWNEQFELSVDKASEVEIVISDQQAGQPYSVPIGLLWVRIGDLVEQLRRQRTQQEAGQAGWVSAGAMPSSAPHSAPGGYGDAPIDYGGAPQMGPGGFPGAPSPEGVEATFAVEPVGAIRLRLNFVKENVRKRPLDGPMGGLGRQGAVRKRKDEIYEMNGHSFIQKQFYQIMLCAYCNEFLLNALGYQCEDCRYLCHKKCYDKVVTKCIAKSTPSSEEDSVNYRIPHRFEPLTNLSANWCCHCGSMLPLGRKNARKCSECDITCHANCIHLVPDFCGMSNEQIRQIIRVKRDIHSGSTSRPPRKPLHSPTQSTHPPVQEFDRLSMGGGAGRGSYPQGPAPGYSPQQPPYPGPGAGRGGPGMGFPEPSHHSPTGQQPGQPQYGGGRPPQPQSGRPGSLPVSPAPGGRISPAPFQQQPQAPYPPPQQQHQQPIPPRQQTAPAPQHQHPPPHHTGSLPPQQPPSRQTSKKRKVGLDDFNFLAVLGKGNFGKVMLAEEKKTNGLYAIKVLKKEFIIDNDEVESTRSEKRVERHPFLLGLHSCFQTETRVYFVMEYVSGGDLMLHIQRKQFSLRQAKFYASEVLLALEYFHSQGIIYRDLKLDNILLTLDGHVKDMYFGNTTSTFCGTPEFMAPEILLEQRYGRAVDWWAFGVLTYEMLLGQSPFRGEDEDEIFDAILEDEPLYPITMPRDAVSILQKLLTRDPTRRLGSSENDAEDIKRQPFFKDVNWDDVVNKRIPPPYFPTINGSADTSNFDEEFTKEQPTLTPVHTQLTAKDQQEFNGFSWVASWAQDV